MERHLHCSGTLDCSPALFERCNKDDWDDLRRVCIETVPMLPGPARGFDAPVVDHYGPLAASPYFELGNKKPLRNSKRKKRKIPKRPALMYLRDPKKKKEEQAPHMKAAWTCTPVRVLERILEMIGV
ncbi:hypothetical protein Aduo_018592 [Ancylostoma duodenale]